MERVQRSQPVTCSLLELDIYPQLPCRCSSTVMAAPRPLECMQRSQLTTCLSNCHVYCNAILNSQFALTLLKVMHGALVTSLRT